MANLNWAPNSVHMFRLPMTNGSNMALDIGVEIATADIGTDDGGAIETSPMIINNVAPGQAVTFQTQIIAPFTPGSYPIMMQVSYKPAGMSGDAWTTYRSTFDTGDRIVIAASIVLVWATIEWI